MSLYVDIEKRLGEFQLRARFECDGGVTGLLGASGSGKSLTLRCIAGIERPDRGIIALDGRALFDSERGVNLSPQARRVGYLFQNYALFPDMTVAQNILCGLCQEKDGGKKSRALREALAVFQLEGLENRRPRQLSGGQQQRVALARIYVNRPGLWMLDEPFSALDAHLRLKLQRELQSVLRDCGRPALMVTHSRDEAYRMCGRIAVLSNGTLQPPEDTRALFANPRTLAAARITGCKNIAPARRVDDHRLLVPDWGVTLTTALPVPDGVTHAGVRAHHFGPDIPENRFPVTFAGDMEEPFEWVIEFRYGAQNPAAPALWWRMPSEKRPRTMPEALGVAPVNVLPLVSED